jgi:hypothetical protein
LIALLTAGLVSGGCSSTAPARTASAPNGESVAQRDTGRGGAELWAQRCSQCHFARDASYFSPAQWEVVMFHMRVRANLTAQEHHEILEFIKSN